MIKVISMLLFLSLTHKRTNSTLNPWVLFYIASALFRIIFPIKSLPDSWKHEVPQSVLYRDCYFSQKHQNMA